MRVLYFLFFPLVMMLGSFNSNAQTFDNAGSYMSYIGQQHREITKDFMSYSSAVAHSSARKAENKRQELIQTVKNAIKKVSGMPPYEGDKSYRDSVAAFLNISYHILNDDYGKIINMEEVSEQSYDAMEAYLLAQDLANEKLDKAGDRLTATEKEFAKKHNVNLIESKDELSEKVAKTSRVNAYHRPLYLIFFKSYKQEAYMLAAMEKKDVNGIEQNRATLLTFSEEGLKKLDTMKAFDGDKNLINACRQMLEFYRTESKDKVTAMNDFFIKEENFNKIKKAFEAKKENQRTKEDVDQYNNAVKEYNEAINNFNNINTQLNTNRNSLIENWNKQVSQFLEKHTPKYK